MLLEPLVHLAHQLSLILAQRGQLRVPLLLEGRTHSEYAVFAFLEGDELLAHPDAASAVLGVTLAVVGDLLLKEVGGQLQFLPKLLLFLFLLEDALIKGEVRSAIFLMDSSKWSCSRSGRSYF